MKAVHRPTKQKSRDIRRELAATYAANAIGPITPGCEIFGLSKGDFSKLEILWHILEATGPADVVIATWTASGYDLGALLKFLTDGRLRSLRFIVDNSFQARKPVYCAALREHFGDQAVRVSITHAKFATVTNEQWNIALRTSMNLNENRRIEFFEISDDRALTDFLLEFTEELYSRHEPGEQFNKRPIDNIKDFDELGVAMSQAEVARRAASGERRALYFGDGATAVDVRRTGWTTSRGKVVK